MVIPTNTTDRKALVREISEALRIPSRYLGPPSFAYGVGAYTIDREGAIHGEDFEALQAFLARHGFIPPAEEAPEAEQGAREDLTEQVVITLPAPDMTARQLLHLVYLMYSKQYLIRRMIAGCPVSISDELIQTLSNHTPESPEEFGDTLRHFKATGGITGVDCQDGLFSMVFPADAENPPRWKVYSDFLSRILQQARKAQRIQPAIQKPDNEKYYARAWLLRLGYGGEAGREARRILLRHLKGHSAFPHDDAARKHREKYAALRREKRRETERDGS